MYELTVLIPPDSDFTLATAAACLAGSARLPSVRGEHAAANRLRLTFGGWSLIICHEAYPWVEEESRELVQSYEHRDGPREAELLARCKTRLAVWSEDPDPAMDHFNDWLLSVECLTARFRGLAVFDPVSGEWWERK